MNYYNATTNSSAVAMHKTAAPAVVSRNQVAQSFHIQSRDSALTGKKDSLKQKDAVPFVNRQRQSSPQQGIVTVDLKKE
jgi:hypothetical protein